MNEGQLFRQLRKDRGLSIRQVADKLNSVSFISKFEKGDSHISIHRMERLLENINVTIEEFYYLRAPESELKTFLSVPSIMNYMTGPYLVYLNRILLINNKFHQHDFKKGIVEMTKISEELNREIRWQNYLYIFCQLLIEAYEANLLESEEIDSERLIERFRLMSRPIVSYLYSVENWGVFEVLLFRLFQFAFPVETIHQLLPTAFSRTEKELGLPVMRELRVGLLFSVLTSFLNFRYFEESKEVMKLLEKTLYDTEDSTNSIYLLFFKGWYQIITESKEKGMEMCQQAISIFRILKQPSCVKHTEYLLEVILQHKENPKEYMAFV